MTRKITPCGPCNCPSSTTSNFYFCHKVFLSLLSSSQPDCQELPSSCVSGLISMAFWLWESQERTNLTESKCSQITNGIRLVLCRPFPCLPFLCFMISWIWGVNCFCEHLGTGLQECNQMPSDANSDTYWEPKWVKFIR